MRRKTNRARREVSVRGPAVALLVTCLWAATLSGAVFPSGKPEWTVDFPGGAIGHPAHFGPVEKTRGVLITEHSGKITLVGPRGEKQLTMTLDMPIETPAVAAELAGDGKLSVVAVDEWGSIYCFNEKGERQWKYSRAVKSGEFRLPVFADLDGDGNLEIFIADSRGHLSVLDSNGRLRMEISATKYRLSVPAVGDVNGDGRPELIFGTDAGEVYCLSSTGDVVWSANLDRCYGRAMPLIADADGGGNYEVYLPTAFNHTKPGLVALDAATGRQLWLAPSVLQTYRSTVVADLDGDGRNEILFGDKNSSLFCLDTHGRQRWTTQLPGRGIYFTPAITDLQGNGASTSFFVVRASGSTGKSLYALDAAGKIVDALALPGGGGCSPSLCRFEGRTQISLLALSSSGRLECHRLEQQPTARILWPGVRNDVLNSGFLESPKSVAKKIAPSKTSPKVTRVKRIALGGTNKLPLPRNPPDVELVSVKTVRPDGSVQIQLLQKAETGHSPEPAFATSKPGQYAVTVRWHDVLSNAVIRADHFVYRLGKNFKADEARLREVVRELEMIGREAPALKALTGLFEARVMATWSQAKGSESVAAFDEFHAQCAYSLRQARYVRASRVAQASTPASSPGVPPGLRAGSETLPQLAAETAALRGSRGAAMIHESGVATTNRHVAASRQSAANSLAGRWRRPAETPLREGGSWKVWLHQIPNPWPNFDAAEFFRQTPATMNSISLDMLGNEYESAAIAVSNLRPHPVALRLACGPFQGRTNQVESRQVLKLHEVLSVRPDGTGELTEDPLPLLGEGQTVRLDGGETRKLWLTFHSRSLSPGTWRAMLKVGDVAAMETPAEIPVTIEVQPVRLPDRFTYRECNWLYLDGIRDEALQDATMRDAVEHGMNVFVIPGVSIQVDKQGKLGQPNTAAHDKLVWKLGSNIFYLVSGPASVQWPARAKPDAELQDKVFADALRWYGSHMQSLGVGYDNFAIYLQDEPGLLGRDAGFEAYVAQVKRFKAAEPRIQLYANPAGGARADLLRPLQGLIDVWAPDLHLVREQPEELKAIFQHGKHYWHYEAPGDQRDLDPLGFYRVKPWVAFQIGMTGGGYWVYSSANYWFTEPGGGTEYGAVYPTEKGPVTTKRWEASRDGIEDFELLWLLRKTAEGSASSKKAEALRLIDDAVRFVTRGQEKVTDISRHVRPYTPDHAQWMEYRRRLIWMQMQLAE